MINQSDEKLADLNKENPLDVRPSKPVTVISSNEKAKLEAEIADRQRLIFGWINFENIDDKVERLAYPLIIDDAYDTGAINEVISQTHVFQGVLRGMNEYCC